jgi:hypothetical protein
MAAEGVGYTPGSGATVAADTVDGVLYQRVKLAVGDNGAATDASATAPLPVGLYGEAIEALEALRMAVQSLNRTVGLMQPDTAARMRVALDSITAGLTLATITTVGTVTTVSTVTNQAQMGGFSANDQVPALMHLQADSLRRNITVT